MTRFALALSLLLAFALSACGTANNNVKANTDPTNSTEATTDGASTTGSKLQKKDAGNMERAEQDE